MSAPQVYQPGEKFKCGPNGSITGTVVKSVRGRCKSDGGYIYTLNKDVTGYKKVYSRTFNTEHIIQLVIPKGALIRADVDHAFSQEKCRASMAIVAFSPRQKGRYKYLLSGWNRFFKYHDGALVTPESPFSMNPRDECASGIHFFFKKPLAEAW